MIQIPVARGLTVREQVIVEENTKNITLVNGFTKRRVESFPSQAQKFCAYALLADGMGEISFRLEIARGDTYEMVYSYAPTIRFVDRSQEVRFFVRIRHCRFPVAGSYVLTLIANGESIADQTIMVLL